MKQTNPTRATNVARKPLYKGIQWYIMSDMINKKYNVSCSICQKEIKTNWSNKKYCSSECRKKQYASLYGRVALKEVPTASVGAIAEMLVGADLLANGFSVFRSLSAACFCDLVAIKGDSYHEVEVRTGYKTYDGKWSFPRYSNERNTVYAVVERNTKEIVYMNALKELVVIESK